MMRTKYKSICVKFREDEPDQIAAWNYLQKRLEEKSSYGATIAELIQGRSFELRDEEPTIKEISDRLSRLSEICLGIKSQMGDNATMIDTTQDYDSLSNEKRKEGVLQLTEGIANMVLSMGDDE